MSHPGRFRLLLLVALLAPLLGTLTCQRSSNQVVIGAVLPMTGDAGKYGKLIQHGMELAVDELNTAGGIDGRTVKLSIQDSQTTPSGGVSAYKQLLVTAHPLVVMTTLTSVCQALIPLAELDGIVLFVNSTYPGLTDGHSLIFRNSASLSSDVPEAVKFISQDLKTPPVAIIWRNDDFGSWGSTNFAAQYKAVGGQVVASESYDPNTQDFRTILTKVAGSHPQVLYLLGYSEVGRLARQSIELGHKYTFFGITTMGGSEAIQLAGGALEGAIYTEPSSALSSDDSHIATFRQSYTARFSEEPDVWAATFYDAVNLVAVALKGKGTPSAASLRIGLFAVHEYPGVSGLTTFLPSGDVKKPVVIKTVLNGKGTEISGTVGTGR